MRESVGNKSEWDNTEKYGKVLEQADINTITWILELHCMWVGICGPCNHITVFFFFFFFFFLELMNKLEKEYGVGWNSLEKHTAEEIFNHEYIQSILPLTWKDPSHRLCTHECQEMCSGGLHSAAWMASTNREEITH